MKYKIAKIPKDNGEFRILHIPDEELKKRQKEYLYKVLAKFNYPELIKIKILGQHKCSPKELMFYVNHYVDTDYKDIYLTEIDIKDFFTNITPDYFLTFMQALDFEEFINTCFVKYKGQFVLPQGAPTSPRLSCLAIARLLKIIDKFLDKKDAFLVNYIDNFYLFHIDETLKFKVYLSIKNYGFDISKFITKRIPYRSENKPFIKMLGYTLCREDNGKIVANVRQKTKHTIRGLEHRLKKGDHSISKKLKGYYAWINVINQINQ